MINRRAMQVLSMSALFSFFFLPVLLRAQIGQSGIAGTVSDQAGALVSNVKLEIRNEATNVAWATTSGDGGSFFVRNLPVGRYTVTAEAEGFSKTVIEHVILEVDKVLTVDIKLTLGAVTQTVKVEASAALVTTTSGTIGNLVTQKELTELPLNGRSWISLNYLTPGAVNFKGGSMDFSNITESVAPGNFSVNGLRGSQNVFFIDGVNLTNIEDYILSILPPLDSLEEFRTQSGNPTAEYFGGGGAMVTAATKSGSNKLHGSGWEYIRNKELDARSFFDQQIPAFKRNQFGFTLGGPIRKDHTFLFGSYEGFRQEKGQSFVGDYPTAAQRAGDLSGLPGQLRDPLNGQLFPGNVIPSSRIHPLSSRWLNNWIPLPNVNAPVGSGNYINVPDRPINYDTYVLRGDHRFNERNSIFARYMYTDTRSLQPAILSGFNRDQKRYGHNLSVQYTRTISATVLAEGRFGYHRYDDNEPIGTDRNANMLEELGVLGKPGFTTVADSQLAPPVITVSGFSQFSTSFIGRPRRIFNRSFYYEGSLFINRGAHAMKMGGVVTANRANFPEIIRPTGGWTYNGFFSGGGFADFLLGFPRTITTSINQFDPNSRRVMGGVWFQDDWKVTPRLSVNLGIRWDIDPRFVSANDSVANWDISKPPIAINITQQNRPAGWDRALVDGPQSLWAPRVGFAYRLAGDHTVVRGGYGVYWQPIGADPHVNISIQYPFITNLAATIDAESLSSFDRTNPLQRATDSGQGSGTAIEKEFKDAYVQQWNFTIEKGFGPNLLTVGYVGNKTTHLYSTGNIDLAPPGPGPIQPRRPYTNLTGLSYQFSGGSSNYHGLQVKGQRRFTRNISFLASYAWGKSISTGDGGAVESLGFTRQQPFDLKAERGLSDFDVRHSLTFSYIYALPFGQDQRWLRVAKGLGGKLVEGWQLEGISRFLTGSPFTVFTAVDTLNNGGVGYPDRICDSALPGGRSSGEKVAQFFNTSCFVTPRPFTFGNAGRNTNTGPGTQVWDFSLRKNTSIGEQVKVVFTAEFFNIFNHPNFGVQNRQFFAGSPTPTFGVPQFGRLFNTTQDTRDVQFGLRFQF